MSIKGYADGEIEQLDVETKRSEREIRRLDRELLMDASDSRKEARIDLARDLRYARDLVEEAQDEMKGGLPEKYRSRFLEMGCQQLDMIAKSAMASSLIIFPYPENPIHDRIEKKVLGYKEQLRTIYLSK